MKIIGLSGKKKSGKDTLCQILKELSPIPVVRLAFADALKREVAGICKVEVAEVEAEKNFFRPLIQWWGTEFRRNYCRNENYWVDQVSKQIDDLPGNCIVVVTDVRYPNELGMIKERGGISVRVTRFTTLESDDHSSETSLDGVPFDISISNDSTIEALRELGRHLLLAVSQS